MRPSLLWWVSFGRSGTGQFSYSSLPSSLWSPSLPSSAVSAATPTGTRKRRRPTPSKTTSPKPKQIKKPRTHKKSSLRNWRQQEPRRWRPPRETCRMLSRLRNSMFIWATKNRWRRWWWSETREHLFSSYLPHDSSIADFIFIYSKTYLRDRVSVCNFFWLEEVWSFPDRDIYFLRMESFYLLEKVLGN